MILRRFIAVHDLITLNLFRLSDCVKPKYENKNHTLETLPSRLIIFNRDSYGYTKPRYITYFSIQSEQTA